MRTAIGCFVLLFLVVITVVAYWSLYFTASQPENHGVLKYKVFAYIIMALLGVEVAGYFWWRNKMNPSREDMTSDGKVSTVESDDPQK